MTEAAAMQIRLLWSMEHMASDHCIDSTQKTFVEHAGGVYSVSSTVKVLAENMRSRHYVGSTVKTSVEHAGGVPSMDSTAENMNCYHRHHLAVQTVDDEHVE